MAKRTYRVIQWATGTVGTVALRSFIENPVYELAGVLVTNPDKVGRDAGELAGVAAVGIAATDDVDAILTMDADCVHFAPLVQDIDMVCRLLRSGKNVVSPLGPYYPTGRFRADCEAIKAACRDGQTSFHGSGIHPGFAGDLLPLTLTRIMERIEHIHVYEIIDHLANPSGYIEFMGFGRQCEDLLANPSRSGDAPEIFAQSMTLVAEALGRTIDNLTTKLEVAPAKRDITYKGGVVPAGTVAGQHYEWTAWSEGSPIITYHCFWIMGEEDVDADWKCGPSGYRVRFEGQPAMEMSLGAVGDNADKKYFGLAWTASAGVNAVAAVCDALPGMVTHADLGLFGPPGILRSSSMKH